MLAKLKRLRGTPFDPFGRTRAAHRACLIGEYEGMIDYVAARLNAGNHAVAVALASLPEKIRGYGYVKERHLAAAETEREELLRRFDAPPAGTPKTGAPLAVAAE